MICPTSPWRCLRPAHRSRTKSAAIITRTSSPLALLASRVGAATAHELQNLTRTYQIKKEQIIKPSAGEVGQGPCDACRYPAVINSWVCVAYAAHMRHMSYAAYDICGVHVRDICGICKLGLKNSSQKFIVFQLKREIIWGSRCQHRRKIRICGDICGGAYAAYVICPSCC